MIGTLVGWFLNILITLPFKNEYEFNRDTN